MMVVLMTAPLITTHSERNAALDHLDEVFEAIDRDAIAANTSLAAVNLSVRTARRLMAQIERFDGGTPLKRREPKGPVADQVHVWAMKALKRSGAAAFEFTAADAVRGSAGGFRVADDVRPALKELERDGRIIHIPGTKRYRVGSGQASTVVRAQPPAKAQPVAAVQTRAQFEQEQRALHEVKEDERIEREKRKARNSSIEELMDGLPPEEVAVQIAKMKASGNYIAKHIPDLVRRPFPDAMYGFTPAAAPTPAPVSSPAEQWWGSDDQVAAALEAEQAEGDPTGLPVWPGAKVASPVAPQPVAQPVAPQPAPPPFGAPSLPVVAPLAPPTMDWLSRQQEEIEAQRRIDYPHLYPAKKKPAPAPVPAAAPVPVYEPPLPVYRPPVALNGSAPPVEPEASTEGGALRAPKAVADAPSAQSDWPTKVKWVEVPKVIMGAWTPDCDPFLHLTPEEEGLLNDDMAAKYRAEADVWSYKVIDSMQANSQAVDDADYADEDRRDAMRARGEIG